MRPKKNTFHNSEIKNKLFFDLFGLVKCTIVGIKYINNYIFYLFPLALQVSFNRIFTIKDI